MILRDVICAEQPRLLGHAARPAGPVSNAAATPAGGAEVLTIPAPRAPVESLSASRVVAWLKTQDSPVRTEIAAALAEELDGLRAKAVAEGAAAGEATGRREAESQLDSAVTAFRSLAQQAEGLFARQREQLSDACCEIVGQALAKLLGEALKNPDATLVAVMQAVERISGAREVIVRVHERDLATVKSRETDIAEVLRGQSFTVVADGRVRSGGCLLESSFGEVDARWETQLTALIDTLRGGHAGAEVVP